MPKKLKLLVTYIFIICGIYGCGKTNNNISYTYSVSTNDKVKIAIDITEGFSITKDIPFSILKNSKNLSQGKFITNSDYDSFVESVKTDINFTLLDYGNINGNEYIFWNYNNSEYNYAVLLNGTDTGVILGNNISEESARECFSKLTISLEK